MAPSPLSEQSIATSYHVEIINDHEFDEPTLAASSETNLGDLQVVTADQVLAETAEQRAQLDRMDALALAFEAATAPLAEPRTWSFTNKVSGEQTEVTCMTGCRFDHEDSVETPTSPEDVYCWSTANASTTSVPVDPGTGTHENFQVLTAFIAVDPFSKHIAERLPHATVEILDEHYIAPLDPDALAGLINLLTSRVNGLRAVHAELVRTRAAYIAQSEVTL
jgi:hypothetical protein